MSTGDYFNFIWNFGTILQTSKLHSDMGEIGSNCVRVSVYYIYASAVETIYY